MYILGLLVLFGLVVLLWPAISTGLGVIAPWILWPLGIIFFLIVIGNADKKPPKASQVPQTPIKPARTIIELAQADKTKLVAAMKADSELCQAVYTVIENDKASTSLLQRKLVIGYSKAAKLIQEMVDLGVISEQDGARPRTVYIDVFQGMPIRPIVKPTEQTETYDLVD